MKVPRGSDRTSTSTNMTPMIDVVFLLIIFFLVSSHLAKQESRMPMDLPVAGTHHVDDLTSKRMTINIAQSGAIQVGGASVTADRIRELLIEHHAKEQTAASVRIRTDKLVQYGVIEPLLREIALAGITDVTFAVQETR